MLLCCVSGKCLINRTVPVDFWGNLMLIDIFVNIIFCVCDCADKICQLTILRAYRAAGLGLNRFQNDIAMNIK